MSHHLTISSGHGTLLKQLREIMRQHVHDTKHIELLSPAAFQCVFILSRVFFFFQQKL